MERERTETEAVVTGAYSGLVQTEVTVEAALPDIDENGFPLNPIRTRQEKDNRDLFIAGL